MDDLGDVRIMHIMSNADGLICIVMLKWIYQIVRGFI
jgi:hypothetical protein